MRSNQAAHPLTVDHVVTYRSPHGPRTKGGFTLIEVMVSLALIATIAGLGLFWSRDLFLSEDLAGETSTLATLLMRARGHSLTNYEGRAHGVCYNDSEHAYESFSGTHDPDMHYETMRIGKTTRVAGLPRCRDGGIIFTQLSATTSPITITLTQGERSMTIEVNREGFIK